MTQDSSNSDRSLSRRLSIKKEPREELVITSGIERDELEEETILASDSSGQTLTLLEEYSMKRSQSNKPALIVAFICAITSLTFAYLNFLTLQ